MRKTIPLFLLIILSVSPLFNLSFSQELNPVAPTTAKERLETFSYKKQMQENSILKNTEFENIGPSIMSGRVVDVEVSPSDPTIFYVAYASGGLWKTVNNGMSFTPLFDNEAVITIGDIAVDWTNNIIYVGTGENNSSRSSYSGTGIYKSTDDGKSCSNTGLEETQHIGRISIDPKNPNKIFVAALGHLYSPNSERGIYVSEDAGKTWKHTLKIDDNTGGIDLVIDPSNSNTVYASMWYRTRRAWNFEESGSTSGIYKSIDGGNTWNLITTSSSGFLTGKEAGRIGLAIYPKNPQIIYAVVDNQNSSANKDEDHDKLTKDGLRKISEDEFMRIDTAKLKSFLEDNGFPEEYTAEKVYEMVSNKSIKPNSLVEYLEDANTLLTNAEVVGAEVYRSDNGGASWKRTHSESLEGIFSTYGYYFSRISVSPTDENKIYVMGVIVVKSSDGGATFKSINEDNVHADHHYMWVDANREGHLINGNDGGLNLSYDDGKTWQKLNAPAVGQFYSINVDNEKPYNVYGGLQDNGAWVGPSNYQKSLDWQQSGEYPYKSIMGGDGMQVQIDSRNKDIVYTGYQFGNYFRIDRSKNDYKQITPQHKLGERPYRFNWQTPIKLSPHNQDILYIGSNKLHRSFNRGDTWEAISGDLTNGGKIGDVPYGTLTTIDESVLKFGLLYTGSDDGAAYVSKDGGNSWEKISNDLPQNLYVSRIRASKFDTARVYISLNAYRYDNMESFVFVSDNYGKKWERIGKDLPAEPVNVVIEDSENKDILFVGTDGGLYCSLDGGKTFNSMSKGLPNVPVHDLVIQAREHDLIVGTHGRSLYKTNLSDIEKLNSSELDKDLVFYDIDKSTYNRNWGMKQGRWGDIFNPKINFTFYSKNPGQYKITIYSDDKIVNQLTGSYLAGLNYIEYDLSIDTLTGKSYFDFISDKYKNDKKIKIKLKDSGKYYLPPGKYKVELDANGTKETKEFEIKESKRNNGKPSPFPKENESERD
ncbi:MAG: glycosyl hydrolase [Bacteroidetes bacterium]|nr:glycosyl hydrolase [Bacteroidota bacterium]